MGLDGELARFFPLTSAALYVLAALSLPHLLYFFVWTQSAAFIRLAKVTRIPAFNLFYQLSVILKFIQLGALAAWYFLGLPALDIHALTPIRGVLAAVLLAAGQSLNMGVYKALGKEGVYYGIKLGKKVEWYEGFPFTVIRDPQYVGCVLSILAFVVLLYSPAFIEAGLLTVAAAWTAFYFVTGLVENFL